MKGSGINGLVHSHTHTHTHTSIGTLSILIIDHMSRYILGRGTCKGGALILHARLVRIVIYHQDGDITRQF